MRDVLRAIRRLGVLTISLLAVGSVAPVSPATAEFGVVASWEALYAGEVDIDPAGDIYASINPSSGGQAAGYRHKIVKFDRNGKRLLEWGTDGTAPGQFGSLTGVAVDGDGNAYVADSNNDRIQKFGPAGQFLAAWGTSGSGNGQFDGLADVAVDAAGNVYATDARNERVQKFNASGQLLLEWGEYGNGNGQFRWPTQMKIDGAGNVFVVDHFTSRVQKFDSAGNFLTKWEVKNETGSPINASDVAVDGAGFVYVRAWDIGAQRARFYKYTGNGALVGGLDLGGAQSIDVADDGTIYAVDDVIRRYGLIPFITITSGPKGKTSKRDATFAWRSDEPGSVFQCRLDGAPWQACSSPKTYLNLGTGSHTFKVRGILKGDVGAVAGRSFRVKKDKLLPKKLKVRRGKVVITIDCDLEVRCKGKVEISGKVKKRLLGGNRGTTRIRFVQPKGYSVAPGGSKRLKLKVTRPARKVLRHKRKLVGTGSLIATNGQKAKFRAILKG